MVPSAAMGRDIPVAFQGGGPHAVVLLDVFNAAPEVSNWATAGNAMNRLAGKGISVAAPAGGAWSLYTDREQDSSRQWETFLGRALFAQYRAVGGHEGHFDIPLVVNIIGAPGGLNWRRGPATWPRRSDR